MASMQPTKHPGNWQATVRILWITQFATMAAFSCSLPFVPLYILELGSPDPRQAALWAGFVAGGSGISMAIFSPIWGSLADRFGKKLMLERALVGAAITLLFMGLAQSVVQLLIFRVLQGSLSGTTAAVSALAASIAPREELGRVLGTMQMSIFAGSTVGPFVGGILADTLGFRFAFMVTSVAMVIIGLVVFVLVREPHEERQPLPAFRLSSPSLSPTSPPRMRQLRSPDFLRRTLLQPFQASSLPRLAWLERSALPLPDVSSTPIECACSCSSQCSASLRPTSVRHSQPPSCNCGSCAFCWARSEAFGPRPIARPSV